MTSIYYSLERSCSYVKIVCWPVSLTAVLLRNRAIFSRRHLVKSQPYWLSERILNNSWKRRLRKWKTTKRLVFFTKITICVIIFFRFMKHFIRRTLSEDVDFPWLFPRKPVWFCFSVLYLLIMHSVNSNFMKFFPETI